MPLNVRIIHPDQILFEGEADYLLLPGAHNVLGLMPGHTPMFAELKAGDVEFRKAGGNETEKLAIEGGIVRIRDDAVLILASPKG